MKNNIPPADKPDWDAPYNFEWFYYHHFNTLDEQYKIIEKLQKSVPLGTAFSQENIKIFLFHLDELAKLLYWLPYTSGGQILMEEVIAKKKIFKDLYCNKTENVESYWKASEIIFDIFTIHNYMSALCGVYDD